MAAAIRAAMGEPVAWEYTPGLAWNGKCPAGFQLAAMGEPVRDNDYWTPLCPLYTLTLPDAQPKPAEDDLRRGLRFPHDDMGTPT